MEFIIGVGSTLVARVVEHTFVAVRRVFLYTSNVENLRARIQELETSYDQLQSRVDQATQNKDIIKEDVQNYICEAARLSREAETFLNNDCQRAAIKCFGGSIPNLVSRRRLSIRAKEKADELASVIQDAAGDRFLIVSSRPALQSYIADRDGYKDFVSRKEKLEEIMAALSSDDVRKVGVYGMGGVGKTMLAKEVARQATQKNLFSEVVFTVVSETPDLQAIQQVVAEKIRLKFDGNITVIERADQLKRRLKEEKRILIILDDIWKKLDLGEVGLNFDKDQKGCKILMTSRSLDVISNSMGAEKNIMVKHLFFNEARNLFNTIVERNVVEQPGIQSLVDDVVRECKGLPLAIRVVASALKGKESSNIWEDALFQLQNSTLTNIEGMLTQVYPSIRLSFDYLESEEAKKLLLLCSLYGEDVNIEVEELMTLCIGWGFFSAVHSVSTARRSIDSLVVKLKDRCLLLDGFGCGWVKMHDVVRDVAIAISSENSWGMHRYMINDGLKDCLSDERLKGTKALSLLRNQDSDKLPERKLECPQLVLFLISVVSYIYDYTPIIMDFLNGSTELKVLSLCKVDLLLLPSSFQFLHKLKTLRLHDCKLDDIDFVGDLENLRVLDLRRSTIQQLPLKIGKLTRLQVLNLVGCEELVVIRENVISSLTELEELYLPKKFNYWKVGEGRTDRINSNLAELMNLKKLTTLFLSIPDAKILPKGFIFSTKLEKYRIGIGSGYDDTREITSRSLVLRDCEESRLRMHGIEALMRRSGQLNLGGLVGGAKNNVVYDLDKEGFPELKKLTLSNCDEVKYVVNALEEKSAIHPCSHVFLELEILHLTSLKNLEDICHRTLTANSFRQLREINVENCGKLKNLFPLSIATRLHRIEVKECEIIEEIGHDHKKDEVVFDELLYLKLYSLPKLVQFINSLPQLAVTNASSSTQSFNYPLFSEKVVLPKLEILILDNINVKMLWADTLPSTSNYYTKNFSELNVSQCNNLEYISSVDLAKSLVKLQKLSVSRCESLEAIFVVNKKKGEDEEGILLPPLQSLELNNLPNLKMFCGTIDKENTQLGEQLPLFHATVGLTGLENLRLQGLNIETLWHDFDRKPLAATSYMENLTYLTVTDCNKLKYLFTVAMVERIVNLRRLFVINCTEIEDVFVVRKKLAREDLPRSEQILFPKLETIKLYELQSLKSFCAGADDCIQLPTLSRLYKINCPKLKTFVEKKGSEKEIGTTKSLFDQKTIVFPNLKELDLSGLNITKLWEDGLSFPNLKRLNLGNCKNVKYVLSSTVCASLFQLERLEIHSCENIEEIVAITEEPTKSKANVSLIIFPKLRFLYLQDLPKLKQFGRGDSVELKLFSDLKIYTDDHAFNENQPDEMKLVDYKQPMFSQKTILFPNLDVLHLSGLNITKFWEDGLSLPNLKYLSLKKCKNLKYVLSSTVCASLFQLERLSIDSCENIEEIVAIAEEPAETKANVSSLFPKLNYLSLQNLPKLKQFGRGDNVECCELRVFINADPVFDQPLYQKVAFPNLRSLLPSCCNLKELYVELTARDKPISLSTFEILQRYPNLKIFELKGSFVNMITCHEGVIADIQITSSSGLQSLSQPHMSFHNLTKLFVSECHELTYLLDSSTARILAQLKDMRVSCCRQMKHIIIRDCKEGEITEDDAFDFKRLEIIVLNDLPNLKSFFSGNNSMMFPRLTSLVVNQCPKMKSFSDGIITTLLLRAVITEIVTAYWNRNINVLKRNAKRECWDEDVNTTIRKLWDENSNSLFQQSLTHTDVVAECYGEAS